MYSMTISFSIRISRQIKQTASSSNKNILLINMDLSRNRMMGLGIDKVFTGNFKKNGNYWWIFVSEKSETHTC